MSIDRTLKTRGAIGGQRSVMTRAERIAKLTDEGKFDPENDSPFGLPKVRVRRSKVGAKSKKEDKAVEEEAAEGAAAAEGDQAKAE